MNKLWYPLLTQFLFRSFIPKHGPTTVEVHHYKYCEEFTHLPQPEIGIPDQLTS